jgi:phosphate-selective porin OprO/OprP
LTKPIAYQVSIQDSFGVLNLFNAYLNFSYDPRFQVRLGRFKTPYTYEFYKLSVYNQIAPERSIYNINFQANRQVGGMLWGELFDKRAEYAVGIFDGPRNSYQDFNGAKDVMAFVNFKPFETKEDSFLRDLNIGGSLDWGVQDNPLNPAVLRTNQQTSPSPITLADGVTTTSQPFLAFNQNVRERGVRSLYELHLAYYYKGLSFLAAADGGVEHYAINGPGHDPVKVPVSGYFVQASYLITGETIRERAVVDPLKPFDLRKDSFGLGAIEPHARFSSVDVGKSVFTGGLSDPNLWANHATLIDVGVNWYLNKYVRVFLDWQHAEFNQPVLIRPGPVLGRSSDLYWGRFQVYF